MFIPPLLAAGESEPTNMMMWVVLGVIALVLILGLWFVSQFIGLWFQAYLSKADIRLVDLIGMYFRKVDARTLVINKISLVQAGLRNVATRDLESHYLAKGSVPHVVRAVIAADRADLRLDWKFATGIDLAGRNVFEAVQTSVNPKVIDCPSRDSGKDTIDAVAADGIQLRVKARVTVRTNLKRLIGGATEETIIARVGEGIVSAIGSASDHKEVLATPDRISKAVLQKGLDAGTAFEILSIDIADVDVGSNIGAKLRADKAEADMRVARANAEERAAMARAHEQENIAAIAESRAKVVLAEAEIPKAIAQALREGNLGLMDYYKLRNIQSDTDMRAAIAKGGPNDKQA